jgi:hypothetical protein
MAATGIWEASSMAQGVEAEPAAGLGVQEAEQTIALTEAEAPPLMEKEAAGLGDTVPKLGARPSAVGDAAGKLDAEAMETTAIVQRRGRPGGGRRVARFCHSRFPIEPRTTAGEDHHRRPAAQPPETCGARGRRRAARPPETCGARGRRRARTIWRRLPLSFSAASLPSASNRAYRFASSGRKGRVGSNCQGAEG